MHEATDSREARVIFFSALRVIKMIVVENI